MPRSCTETGLDHEKLTYFYNGRNMRLTDVFLGELVEEVHRVAAAAVIRFDE
jgi:hypothetical protein